MADIWAAMENHKSRDWTSHSPSVPPPRMLDADSSMMFPIDQESSFTAATSSPFFPVVPVATSEIEMVTRSVHEPVTLGPSFPASPAFPLPPKEYSPPATPDMHEDTKKILVTPTVSQRAREEIELDFSGGAPPARPIRYNDGFKGWLLDEANRTLVWIIGIFLFSAFVLIIILPSYFVHAHPLKREYFIAIEEVDWDYAPGKDDLCRAPGYRLDSSSWVKNGPTNLGSIYKRPIFVGYTDSSFRQKVSTQGYMGFIGPVIRGVEGDDIHVTVINYASVPYSFHADGLFGDKANEGAKYKDLEYDGWPEYRHRDDSIDPTIKSVIVKTGFGKGYHIVPGKSFTAKLKVTKEGAPGPDDSSSVVWMYRAFMNGNTGDLNNGLSGPIVITRADSIVSEEDPRPKDVDEYFMFFSSTDENQSPFLTDNVRDKIQRVYRAPPPTDAVAIYDSDRVKVLQALYTAATGGVDTLDYSVGQQIVTQADTARTAITSVRGTPINTWLLRNSKYFDPSGFDSLYGPDAAFTAVKSILPPLVDFKGESFKTSNVKHNINGYIFCNGPQFSLQIGKQSRFYFAATGAEAVHPKIFNMPIESASDRKLSMLPGTTLSIDLSPKIPGIYELGSTISSHKLSGQSLLFSVTGTPSADILNATSAAPAVNYYLKAEQYDWKYVTDTSSNACSKSAYTAEQLDNIMPSANRIGASYKKARFVRYSALNSGVQIGNNFSTNGIMGPALRANVGSVIAVTVTNTLSFPISFDVSDLDLAPALPRPLTYPISDELSVVKPNQVRTFKFYVSPSLLSSNEVSRSLQYGSRRTPGDTHSGLIGPLVVYPAGYPIDGTPPTGFDTEIFLLMGSINENISPLLAASATQLLNPLSSLSESPDFIASNIRRSVNGYSYCSGSVAAVKSGSRVRAYALGMGVANPHRESIVDVIGISPAVLTQGGVNSLFFPIFEGDSLSIDFTVPTHVDHLEAATLNTAEAEDMHIPVTNGTTYSVTPITDPNRTYYIGADTVEWDYAPSDQNMCAGRDFTEEFEPTCVSNEKRIGHKYVKGIFREYTASDFDRLRQGVSSRVNVLSQHLGILGPIIRAEAGDSFSVVLRNNLHFPVGFAIEGMESQGPTQPGEVKTYYFTTSVEMGPSATSPTSVARVYSSDVDPVAHRNAGLFGVLLITRKGEGAGGDVEPINSGRELVAAFALIDENLSPFLSQNMALFMPKNTDLSIIGDTDFIDSNKMYTVNGYVYCNGEGWETKQDSTLRFYLVSIGDESSAVALFGHNFRQLGNNFQSIGILPGYPQTADLKAINPGRWMFQSTGPQTDKGMGALFIVDRRSFG